MNRPSGSTASTPEFTLSSHSHACKSSLVWFWSFTNIKTGFTVKHTAYCQRTYLSKDHISHKPQCFLYPCLCLYWGVQTCWTCFGFVFFSAEWSFSLHQLSLPEVLESVSSVVLRECGPATGQCQSVPNGNVRRWGGRAGNHMTLAGVNGCCHRTWITSYLTKCVI